MMVCNINNKDLHAIIPDWGELMAFYKKVKKKKPTQSNSVHAVGPYNQMCWAEKTKIILHSDISVI